MTPEHILVAGGAGFIGTHLTRTLLDRGHSVVVADDFSTTVPDALEAESDHPNLRVLRHDVTEPLALECDVIFNLACPAAPIHYQVDPTRTWKTSILGAMHLSELALRNEATLIHASTSEVYGDPLIHPQREDYAGNVEPIGPRACYDEGKRAAETLLTDLCRTRGLDLRMARIFNTYGPGMALDDGRLVVAFAVAALTGAPLELHGDGGQTRSLCYVSDMVAGLIRLWEVEAVRGVPVNLGNPQEVTVRRIAEEILAITGSDSPLREVPRPVHDPSRRRPDITRARDMLSWEPVVSRADGLAAVVEDVDARLMKRAD